MKYLKLFTKLITVLLLVITSTLNAQDLPGFNYQAVARDADGNLIANTKITVTIRILPNEKDVVWEEEHTLITSDKGMFSIPVGTNKKAITFQEVESLALLNWKEVIYQLNVIVNDTDMGSSPILSVPIAMYGEDADADPDNEIQELRLSNGNLEISKGSTSINLSDFLASELTAGAVGIGTDSPEGVMDVQGSLDGDEPIFQVKNNDGIPVFAVYNEGVRVYIPEDLEATKGIKGGFAVGGYNSSKALDTDDYFMKVMPHGADISFFTDDSEKGGNDGKISKGGFAVGGYNSSKSDRSSFVYMDPYAAPISSDGGYIIYLPLFDAVNEKGNCYIGTMAGQSHEGHFNTSIGYQTGFSLNSFLGINPITGLFSTSVAKSNTFLGAFAGYENTYGDENVYLGYQAGFKNQGSGNVFIGNQSGADYGNVSNKLIFDNDADDPSPLIFGDFEQDYLHFNARIGINVASRTDYALTVSNGLYVYGNIYSTGTISPSDKRFKKDIVPISNALNIINSINGVRFNWNPETYENKTEELQIGVIAQEVEIVLPELVLTGEDGYKAVDYSKLTAVLIQAIKEQQVLIEEQQKEIDELKTSGNLSSEEMMKLMSEMQETIVQLSIKVAAMEQFASAD